MRRAVQKRQETTAVGKARVPVPIAHEGIRIRVEALMARVDREVGRPMSEEAQDHLADVVALLPRIADANAMLLMSSMEAAADSLLAEKPNIQFARQILRSARKRLRKRRRLAPLMIGLGGGILVFAVLYTVIFIYLQGQSQFLGFDHSTTTNIALVTVFGALGASVSLILRIKDFSKLREIDSEVLLYTAIFKPMVGASFALFVFMALNAGIVQLTIAQGKDRFLFAAVAFVAGFSERFVKDVIHKVAGSVDEEDAGAVEGTETATADLTGAIRTTSVVTIPEVAEAAALAPQNGGEADDPEPTEPRTD